MVTFLASVTGMLEESLSLLWVGVSLVPPESWHSWVTLLSGCPLLVRFPF